MDVVIIGPECFAALDDSVISWKGRNYYRSCDALVTGSPDGDKASTHCVRRIGHGGNVHEDYNGSVRTDPKFS